MAGGPLALTQIGSRGCAAVMVRASTKGTDRSEGNVSAGDGRYGSGRVVLGMTKVAGAWCGCGE